MMEERKDNNNNNNVLPPTGPPRRNLSRPISAIVGEASNNNITSSSSSSTSNSFSSLSVSPPDLLRNLHATFKRHRPIGTMQSNFSRATRVLVPQTDLSKNDTSTSSVASNNAGRILSKTGARGGASRLPSQRFDQRKDGGDEVRTGTPEDPSPPSVTGTVNMCPFGIETRGSAFPAAASSHLTSSPDSDADDIKDHQFGMVDNVGSTFQKGEAQLDNLAAINDPDPKQQDLHSMEMSGIGGTDMLEKREEQRHNQPSMDPSARSIAVGSSGVTTMSIHSGPTFQCTRAPLGAHTQMSSSTMENALGASAHVANEGQEAKVKEGVGRQDYQHAPQLGEGSKEKRVSANAVHLQSQVNPSSNIDMEPSQSNKVEKVPRKKKYDPDVFFKVNGKLYQKLGKIGSGGSSEVHKVITSDCTIYALKKIKLKGRDYPTAYGFCQEIEYLNKLKGKSNIIQLIDYEVTDKTLLQEVINGSMTIKDGRIKDDQYIYMVLEYGEIDLAHMLSHKWREVDNSNCKIDENWLRFYWQQMLEAVNTIHEERIVHSDLKPANFLLVRGSLKLIDFGIAKAILSDTTNIQRDAQVGTLNYMSPEAFMWNEQDASGNTIKCGRPSDIWSLGCILYQMVYGKTPFAEYKTFWAKFKVITDKNHKISFEPVSNPWLIDLMKRCLAWDRDERWRIPQLLQHPFLVPPMPMRELLPPAEDNYPCKFLSDRIRAHWDDPQVSKLCTELHAVITNLERAQKAKSMDA